MPFNATLASQTYGRIVVSFLVTVLSLSAQTDIIKNGSFADTSYWELGVYGDAKGAGSVSENTYTISPQTPGALPWFLQFTQKNVRLDSGSVYRFSFDVAASRSRTIEACVCMNGGDYRAYSSRDTLQLGTSAQRFEQTFLMKRSTDTSARVEFNCGFFSGDVSFRNVSLLRLPTPFVAVGRPEPGALVFEGVPVTLSWVAAGLAGTVSIELSTDNGLTWTVIAKPPADSTSYQWAPGKTYSPWSLVRIVGRGSDGKEVVAVSPGPFEIAPHIELVRNGTFSEQAKFWNLGNYGGMATGSVTADGVYDMAIQSKGGERWQIQFTQTGIVLIKDVKYVLSFTAYAAQACSIMVNIGMANGPYYSYFDTTRSMVAIDTAPKRYSFDFTMNAAADSNARLEFNCGHAATPHLYLDNISLTKKYVAGSRTARRIAWYERSPGTSPRFILKTGRDWSGRILPAGSVMYDLKGRSIGYLPLGPAPRAGDRCAPGVYIVKPSRETLRDR